jgi:hypothetical protein
VVAGNLSLCQRSRNRQLSQTQSSIVGRHKPVTVDPKAVTPEPRIRFAF